ncbi:hypothetical protein KUDE01_014845 [Dissostichus eleginoides]|uniref:Uncharacterized protein n=1 Tax=Dissostichus eleginoides TaxID=100907 RepID=A0AAD9BWA4_DISEL|nr:hypothetical protein KUDE01_014845 [Dissostichus eleginoides]
MVAVCIDPLSPPDPLCSASSPPCQCYPSLMWSWEAFGAAAGAAVTSEADNLNWFPWGRPLGGAEQGSNCGGMLERTHAGLV